MRNVVLTGQVVASGLLTLFFAARYGVHDPTVAWTVVQAVIGFIMVASFAKKSMTIGSMRVDGIHSLVSRCERGHRTSINVDDLAGDLRISEARRRLRCETCGLRPVAVAPDRYGVAVAMARPAVVAVGGFFLRHRNWAFPVLIVALFTIAIPSDEVFGSKSAEHVKDGIAIMIALGGLVLRGLVAGQRPTRPQGQDGAEHPFQSVPAGLYASCRNPLYAGDVLIATGILLMHGNVYTSVIGIAGCVLVYNAMVRAEEESFAQRLGPAYRDYCNRVPRWIPNLAHLGEARQSLPLDISRIAAAEYVTIGLAVAGLALTELYEELAEQIVDGRSAYLQVLLGITLMAGVWMIAVRFLKSRNLLAVS